MKAIFNEIYASRIWGPGSGEGSLPEHTKGYRGFLEQFIRDRRVKRVVDYGCGDWQFSRLIDWSGVEYLGLDVVDALIDHHQQVYGAPNIRFQALDGVPAELPGADLIILKDVLQHWSQRTIASFMPAIARYRYALITNCVEPFGPTRNHDIADGGFRPLDLTRAPFSYELSPVFEFTNRRSFLRFERAPRWKKVVLLQQRMDA